MKTIQDLIEVANEQAEKHPERIGHTYSGETIETHFKNAKRHGLELLSVGYAVHGKTNGKEIFKFKDPEDDFKLKEYEYEGEYIQPFTVTVDVKTDLIQDTVELKRILPNDADLKEK